MTYGDVVAIVRRFWRVPFLAVLAALLAYVGSFAVSPSYESETRLLVRGRDATFLTTTGRGLEDQPGVIDATLAKALGETQSALASTRRVAEMVVDDLRLDRPRPQEEGAIAAVRDVVKGVYKRARAYVTYGFYAEPDAREAAVEGVRAGLRAAPLEDSYVVELLATADAPDLAAAIANSAADALVTISRDRFRTEARRHRVRLAGQLRRTGRAQQAAAAAAERHQRLHGLGGADVETRLNTRSNRRLRQDLVETEVDLRAAEAQLAALTRQLPSIPPTDRNVSRIRTGRGMTEISATDPSDVYQGLRAEEQRVRAEVASLAAKRDALRAVPAVTRDPDLSPQEARLVQLRVREEAAEQAYRQLHARHQEAVVNARNERAELTRLDHAAAALYPSGPKRYLFLALGGLAGALAGLVLSFVSASRRVAPARPAGPVARPSARSMGARVAAGDGAPRGFRYELYDPGRDDAPEARR